MRKIQACSLAGIPEVFQVIVDPDKGLLDQVVGHPVVSHRMQDESSDPLVILVINFGEVHFSTPGKSGTAFRTAFVGGQGAGIPFLAREAPDAVFHQHIDIILDFVGALHGLLNICRRPGRRPGPSGNR